MKTGPDRLRNGGVALYEETERLEKKRRELLNSGVIMLDPSAVYAEDTVTVGAGTLLLPGTILRGNTSVGRNCTLGPDTMLTDCTVGDDVTVNSSQCEKSRIGDGCEIGPFAHIRPSCTVGEKSKLGAFVQVKNSALGAGTKMAHLTYVGDSDVGAGCNFGCGTVTCNYDGFTKSRTRIGDRVFIGCNTNFVPPVSVGDGAYIAAASTVTEDVPADALTIGRVRQENKKGGAEVNRRKHGAEK